MHPDSIDQLFAIVTAILLLSLLIIWLLLKGVKNPLVDLTATMEQHLEMMYHDLLRLYIISK